MRQVQKVCVQGSNGCKEYYFAMLTTLSCSLTKKLVNKFSTLKPIVTGIFLVKHVDRVSHTSFDHLSTVPSPFYLLQTFIPAHVHLEGNEQMVI